MGNSRRKFLMTGGLITAGSLLFPIDSITLHDPKKEKIKPKALKAGDTIAITSPAGAVWDLNQIETFLTILKSFGFNVVLGKTLNEKWGYFAGTDELRAKELNDFFADPNIKGIFCMKGGWGCARLLDKLNYKVIQQNPKVLIGFSDITTLLIAITHKTGLVTFHGPVGNSGWNDFTKNAFNNVVQTVQTYTYAAIPSTEEPIITINPGKATGELVGGNLTVITSLIGSGYLPDWKGKLLFLEDFKEEPYSIDRMLTQLKLCGVLDAVNGIVFGKCSKCVPEEPLKSFTLTDVLNQHLKPLNKPAFYGAMIGHIENKITVPIGINATMNADSGTVSLIENSVS